MQLEAEYIRLKKAILDKEYSFLNSEQREAVFNVTGPLLILAGAGSGKTTVIVNRIAYLIKYGSAYYDEKAPKGLKEEDIAFLEGYLNGTETNEDKARALIASNPVKPFTVLAITFTNKAANEMKERLVKMLGCEGEEIWASTFHSACVRILRREIEKLNYSRDFTIYDADDSLRLIKDCIKQLSIDEKNLPPKAICGIISKAKDEMIDANSFLTLYANDYRLRIAGNVYELYQKRLKEANALDFDDLIMLTVKLLSEHEDVREFYRRRFNYVLVDEYQDTNHLQYQLVSLLTGDKGNICVVGDDDQSIYKFRGATIENILNFEDHFKDVKVIRLEQNYRSVQIILDAANNVIRNNTGRKGKKLWTENIRGKKIVVYKAHNQDEESRYIAVTVETFVRSGEYSYSDFAVLYRTNAQNRVLSDQLSAHRIPNRVIGGTRFYDRKEIKDMIAYLSVIANPKDDLRLKRIINEPSRKIGGTTMENAQIVADSLGVSLFEALSRADEYPLIKRAAPQILAFCDMIEELRSKIETLPLNELYEEMLTKSSYIKGLEKEDNYEARDRIENIAELSSAIVEYMQKDEEATLNGFLEEVALVADIDNYDSTAGAVTLMTLHSAKGLEFPVVFITGAEEGLFPSGQAMYNPDDLEEERRLAYVGITRAKQRLYFLTTEQRTLYGTTQYNRVSRFVNEIPSYLKEEEGILAEQKAKAKRKKISAAATKWQIKMPSSQTSQSEIGYVAGETVEHKVFGKGLVISATQMGNDIMLEIAFEKTGTKRIMANFANLKKPIDN